MLFHCRRVSSHNQRVGSRIVCTSSWHYSGIPKARRPSLWEISILGGTPRKLAEEGSSPRVSPDGSKIAFLKGPWDSQEIWLMEPDGNGARKILDAGDEWFGPVVWAPDGKQFAYIRGANSTIPDGFWKRIDVYDLARGRERKGFIGGSTR